MTDDQVRKRLVDYLMSTDDEHDAWEPVSPALAARRIGVTEVRILRAAEQLGRVNRDNYTGEIYLWK